MKSEVKEYIRPDGAIQRVQVVRFDDWSQLDFLQLEHHEGALECFCDIYRNYLVPAAPWIFRSMIMFQLPKDLEVDFPMDEGTKYGQVSNPLTVAAIMLQNGVKLKKGRPFFKNDQAKELWQKLEGQGCIRVVCGKMPGTKVIPVGKLCGYLSEQETKAQMKVNASFFIMDPIDCASIYDEVGTILGLCVKEGMVLNPPLYGREAFLVKTDGSITIRELDVKDLRIEINGTVYAHDKNASIYTRPKRSVTPNDKRTKFVIIGNRVAAVKHGGSVSIPASGFVLCVEDKSTEDRNDASKETQAGVIEAGMPVVYHGLEDVSFGIQVGNSIIREGKRTEQFISKFYNIRKLERVPFPPSLYPMDYENGRAARIALGADAEGKPMIFWAEGAGKLSYIKGEDSTGASLREMTEIAENIGMVNGVNLDGGGSAQILINNRRTLKISDRKKTDNSEAERLVPLGLVVR